MLIKNSERSREIFDLLPNSLVDSIEILANVLLLLGFKHMGTNEDLNKIETIIDYVAKYKKQHGETLEGALAHQGLLMLMWLNNRKQNG